MDSNQIIENVREFATRAHGDQRRKYTPDPYIVHPIRVMEICRRVTNDVCILSAALLHDVLEDTPVSKPELGAFLRTLMDERRAVRTLQMVVDLTDVYVKQAYPQFNRRRRKDMERKRIASTSPDAQTVKYADIIDNCREIVAHDRDFAKVFLYECRATLRVISAGNGQLYEEARNIVDNAIASLKANA